VKLKKILFLFVLLLACCNPKPIYGVGYADLRVLPKPQVKVVHKKHTQSGIQTIPSPTPTVETFAKFHMVKEGDSLQLIAEKYHLDFEILALFNQINPEEVIFPGQVLRIPSLNEPEYEPIPGKSILVVVSEQKTYALLDGKVVREFVVSTGMPNTPTVIGTFAVYNKLEKTRMTGDNYDLKDVPWTMYFFQGYSLHGTYWHNNFGHPMSHGCINMKNEDAKWLFEWAKVGTLVQVVN